MTREKKDKYHSFSEGDTVCRSPHKDSPPLFAASVQKEESMEKRGFFWEMKILKLSASSARSKKRPEEEAEEMMMHCERRRKKNQ